MKKITIARNLVVMLLCMTFGFPVLTHAAWSDNPAVNTPISTMGGDDLSPAMITDGAGGAIVTWQDDSSGPYDIYAQRVAADGSVSWTSGGVAICTAANNQWYPQIVSDGAGGAIITWQDGRASELSYDIYAQRILADGNVKWQADGVPVCTMPRHQYNPQAISDGAGGAIVTWQDVRSGGGDIYAQEIRADGTLPCTSLSVRIGETFLYFSTVGEAYNTANDGDTLKMKALDLTETNLVLAKNIAVLLQGGV